MTEPYVSIALCTYNGEKYIAEQLRSIAAQTRKPEELVINDDQSTDSTVNVAAAVCREAGLAASIEVNEERLGVDANFSRALGRTNGEVIFFCDQDDVWMPERIAKMLAPFSRKPDVTLVYCDAHITKSDLTRTGVTLFGHGGRKMLANGDQRDVPRLLKQGRNPGVKASAMAFRSNVKHRAWPLPPGIEHDAWLACFGYALGEVVALDEPLYCYRRHSGTAGRSSTNLLVGEERRTPRDTQYADRIIERAHFLECLDLRMKSACGKNTPSEVQANRFRAFQNEISEAARLLRRRADLIQSQTRIARVRLALVALLAGSYGAFSDYREKLKHFRKDLQSIVH